MFSPTTTTARNTLLTMSPPSSSSFPSNPSPFSKHNTHQFKLPNNNKSKNINKSNHSLKASPSSTPIFRSYSQKSQSQTRPIQTPSAPSSSVTVRLNHLASEFNSLTEPIERVKRLLHYASMLPPLDESDRVPENRVAGCSTQVWLVSGMDEEGRMRFRADSDSEISKGFCWCLVWVLDGAEPHEVLRVDKEDLAHVEVLGLGLKAQSRVNTWHNVLFGMQKATRDLVLSIELKLELELEGRKKFPSLVVTPHGGDNDDDNNEEEDDDEVGDGFLPKGKCSRVELEIGHIAKSLRDNKLDSLIISFSALLDGFVNFASRKE